MIRAVVGLGLVGHAVHARDRGRRRRLAVGVRRRRGRGSGSVLTCVLRESSASHMFHIVRPTIMGSFITFMSSTSAFIEPVSTTTSPRYANPARLFRSVDLPQVGLAAGW